MKIQMEMNQQLVLSQKMIQSAQVLQLSAQELKTYIEEMALENPTIDLIDAEPPTTKAEEIKRKLDWLEQVNDNNRVSYSNDDSHEKDWDIFNTVPAENEDDLEAFLKSQLLTRELDGKEKTILTYMIQNLDSKGYLNISLEEIVQTFHVDTPYAERLLNMLQQLEPAGVGGRNLAECLLLQLKRQYTRNPIAEKIVADYLDLLGKNQLPLIAKKMGTSVSDVKAALEMIQALNPKPSNSFSDRETLRYIVPDVTVVKLRDHYEILLSDYLCPKISINTYYRNMLNDRPDPDVVAYIADKIKQAEWVKTCLERRGSTLLNVSKLIVNAQLEFFEIGKGLRPLKMVDLASLLDVHESTISRAVKDKYLQCMWGVFPLSYFFSRGVDTGDEEEPTTSACIQQLMVKIIDEEDKSKPLSDQKIANTLMNKNCTISRRTVAKYRGILGIKDASGRKSF
ncbi:RNA polymerase factor sigma-54 [Lachnospiraceae bacterium ZAX-1]